MTTTTMPMISGVTVDRCPEPRGRFGVMKSAAICEAGG